MSDELLSLDEAYARLSDAEALVSDALGLVDALRDASGVNVARRHALDLGDAAKRVNYARDTLAIALDMIMAAELVAMDIASEQTVVSFARAGAPLPRGRPQLVSVTGGLGDHDGPLHGVIPPSDGPGAA